MILLIFTGMLAAFIIGLALIFRPGDESLTLQNEELDKFYEMNEEPVPAQMRQLLKAARVFVGTARELNKKLFVGADLYEAKLISKEYYRALVNQEKDLELAKVIIENEAEALPPGSKDHIMSEANKMPDIKKTLRKKIMDEALFKKRQNILLKSLRERILGAGVNAK